jgi:8-oxo-dGTP pyrophosphatase MutT (NUDIX family)
MEKETIIYLNERPLVIVANPEDASPKYTGITTFEQPDKETIESTLQALETGKSSAAIFVSPNPKELLEQITSYFTVLVAAGGLITNSEEEILLMFRRGKWDLPKGKQDDGEDLETCALREVEEETGLHSITLEHKITETMHFYTFKEKRVLKHTYWYKMQFTGTELTIPQIEEDILDIQWVKPEHLNKYLKFSYQNITDVFEKDGYPV